MIMAGVRAEALPIRPIHGTPITASSAPEKRRT